MAYCTKAEIEAALGGASELVWITDPTNTAADTDAITSAIESASALIDSYAAGTPGTGTTSGALWDSTPIQAKHAAIAISVYKLYQRVRREDIPPGVVDDYELYVGPKGSPEKGLLWQLAHGKISWVTTEAPAIQNTGVVYRFNGTCADTTRSTNPRRTMRWQTDKL